MTKYVLAIGLMAIVCQPSCKGKLNAESVDTLKTYAIIDSFQITNPQVKLAVENYLDAVEKKEEAMKIYADSSIHANTMATHVKYDLKLDTLAGRIFNSTLPLNNPTINQKDGEIELAAARGLVDKKQKEIKSLELYLLDPH